VPHGSIPAWSQASQDHVSPQGLLQPAPSCPVRRRARHRGWPRVCGEDPPGAARFRHVSLATPAPLKASGSGRLTPDLHKDKMTTLREREEVARESEGGSSPEVAVSTCVRKSLGYEDLDEFAFSFEDYDLWESIRNHLGYPGGEPTCKYRSSDPRVAAVDQSPQLKCVSLALWLLCARSPCRVGLLG